LCVQTRREQRLCHRIVERAAVARLAWPCIGPAGTVVRWRSQPRRVPPARQATAPQPR
jgi:hypothetical protein